MNPVYRYSPSELALWAVPEGDRAVRAIIAKFCWGDTDFEISALDGWDRYQRKEGVYLDQLRVLSRKVDDPLAFFRHVKGTSTLEADRAFAQIAIWLVCGFSNQSASERTNKYMVEVQGQKKATNLDLDKGRYMLDLRMHLTFKIARQKAHKKEQREGQIFIAHDLRAGYMAKRKRA